MWVALKKSYLGIWNVLRRYWSAYGGFRALLLSAYFHVAIVITAGLSHYWQHDSWWDLSLSVLPNILGFTLAGFTIWLGFGDENFRQRLSALPEDGKTSAFMGVSAGFLHFIIVQIIALLCAVWAKAMQFTLPAEHWLRPGMGFLEPVGNAIGFLLFVYALMAALAASLGVFRAASWYDDHRRQ